ncbi:MAG: hypothetical protein CK431_21340 [Mycobacterium sp.]|nr:MAG: hypothetical protein CK431_21340 [Mycobacterium sp.]
MTAQPEQPDPAAHRREAVRVDHDIAAARRYLSVFEAEDPVAMQALLAEISRSGRALYVLAAMALQALDFGHVLAAGGALRDRHDRPITLQTWLDSAAFEQLDIAAAGERLLRDEQ